MAVSKEKKKEWMELWKEKLNSSSGVWVTDYISLTANEINEIRRAIRETGAELRVVKNRLFKMILEGEWEGLSQFIEGPTAVIFCPDDGIETLKKLKDLSKEYPPLKIRGGYLEGRILKDKELDYVAKLPSKNVLFAQVMGSLLTPLYNLHSALKGLLSSLAYILTELKGRKEKEEGNDG